MSKALIHTSERLYAFLLQFYPRNYRQEFGREMQYVFSESLKDAYRKNGEQGIIALWTRTIIDAGKSLFTEHLENRKGGESMKKNNDLIMQNKIFGWIAAGTAVILTLPYLGMQLHVMKPYSDNPADHGLDWSVVDFVIMGLLLFGTASIFVLIARATPRKYRIYVGLAVIAAFLLLWVHLAVGIVNTWPLAGS